MKIETFAFYIGRFIGVTELAQEGLMTPEQFLARCVEIAKEYQKAKEDVTEAEEKPQGERAHDLRRKHLGYTD